MTKRRKNRILMGEEVPNNAFLIFVIRLILLIVGVGGFIYGSEDLEFEFLVWLGFAVAAMSLFPFEEIFD